MNILHTTFAAVLETTLSSILPSGLAALTGPADSEGFSTYKERTFKNIPIGKHSVRLDYKEGLQVLYCYF